MINLSEIIRTVNQFREDLEAKHGATTDNFDGLTVEGDTIWMAFEDVEVFMSGWILKASFGAWVTNEDGIRVADTIGTENIEVGTDLREIQEFIARWTAVAEGVRRAGLNHGGA